MRKKFLFWIMRIQAAFIGAKVKIGILLQKSSSLLKRGEGKKLVFPQLSTKFIIQYRT